MASHEQRQSYLQTLREFPARLRALVGDLSPEQLTTPYLPNEWTVAQNVHHLADSHMNAYIRLKLILTESKPLLKPYDQNDWANLPEAGEADIEASLLLLEGLHHRWVKVFEGLQSEDWNRLGYHPEVGDVTPGRLLKSYHDHCLAHLDQIERTLAAQG
jgi:hypothetical protein